MDLRIAFGSLFAFGLPAFAQSGTPAAPPTSAATPVATPAAAPQDPEKAPPSPQSQLEQLEKEKARLLQEIEYAKTRSKVTKVMLRDKFAAKAPTHRAIDAGVNTPPAMAMPTPLQPRPARIATPEQLEAQPEGTLLIVNGRPVPQAAFTQLMTYSAGGGGEEATRAQMALFELVRIESVASMVEENEAIEKAAEAVGKLEAGTAIADLIKQMAVVPGASPEGRVEVTRGSVFGQAFEMVAFGTEAGKRSRPFRTVHGIAVLQVESREKGATPELDKVIATALLAAYPATPEELTKAQMAATTGQIDLLVKDQQTFDLLPAIWKPVAQRAAAVADVGDTTKAMAALDELSRQMAELQGKTDDASVAQLKQLSARYAQAKRALSGQAADDAPEILGSPETEAKKEEPKKDVPKKDMPKKQG